MKASALQIAGQAEEVDLVAVGARPLLQQHVATLNEPQAPPVRLLRGARMQGRARRDQRAFQPLWLVSEIGDEVAHVRAESIAGSDHDKPEAMCPDRSSAAPDAMVFLRGRGGKKSPNVRNDLWPFRLEEQFVKEPVEPM